MYPQPPQNQPPQSPYGQPPPYGQMPPQSPYGQPPPYSYRPPPQNNQGLVIGIFLLVAIVVGVGTFLLLSNNNSGLCNPSNLSGVWNETNGIETLTITSNTLSTRSGSSNYSGSYSCSGNTINWTINGITQSFEVVSLSGNSMTLKVFGVNYNYRRR